MAEALVVLSKRIKALEERVKFLSRKDGERSNKHKQLTIAAGEVDVQDRTYYKLHPETGTTDDLDTINGGQDGYLVSLQIAEVGDAITLKDGTGNLALNGDLVLNTVDDVAFLLYNAAEATWCIIGFNHSTGGLVDADTLQGHPASDFVFVTDYEDLDVLNKVKNVDGPGSGLDADLLDGLDSADFALVVHTHTASQITDFEEAVEDVVGDFIADSATIDATYDDPTNTLSLSIKTDSVDNTMLSDMAEATVQGRAVGAGIGNPGPLSAAQLNAIVALANLVMDNGIYIATDTIINRAELVGSGPWHTHRMSVDAGTRTIAAGYSLVVPEFEIPSGMALEITFGGILMTIG